MLPLLLVDMVAITWGQKVMVAVGMGFGLQLHETRVVGSAGFGIGCFWCSLRPVLDVREALVSRLATRLY